MAIDLTQKTYPKKPFTGARIIFGMKPPKNWKENSYKQKDKKYQELFMAWYREQDPELKEKKGQALNEYWSKRRVELGFTEPEE